MGEFRSWLFDEKKVKPAIHHDIDKWFGSVDNLKKDLEKLKDKFKNLKSEPTKAEKDDERTGDDDAEKTDDEKDKELSDADEGGGSDDNLSPGESEGEEKQQNLPNRPKGRTPDFKSSLQYPK